MYIHSPVHHLLMAEISTVSLQFKYIYPASTWARCISPVPLLVKQGYFHQFNFKLIKTVFINSALLKQTFFMSIQFLRSKSLFRQSSFHFQMRVRDMCKIVMVVTLGTTDPGNGRPWEWWTGTVKNTSTVT